MTALASVPSISETPREGDGRIQELETVTAPAAPYSATSHYRWRKSGGEKRATSEKTNAGGRQGA